MSVLCHAHKANELAGERLRVLNQHLIPTYDRVKTELIDEVNNAINSGLFAITTKVVFKTREEAKILKLVKRDFERMQYTFDYEKREDCLPDGSRYLVWIGWTQPETVGVNFT